jgi:vacuolar-type H+-ATPase subunit E/Vma4
MSKKTIEKNLIKALLNDGAMEYALFEYELEEHIDEYLKSKQEDKDDYFFAVTEHTNDVAMLLIDGKNKVYVNEKARALLKKLWPKSAYKHNMKILIPQMVDELSRGYLFVTGVKVQQSAD